MANFYGSAIGFGGGVSGGVPYDCHFLVQAGGGANGWSGMEGGAGGGGLRTSYGSKTGGDLSAEPQAELVTGTEYTISVGAGGVGQANPAGTGYQTLLMGTDSFISGDGFTTITSDGGGHGGFQGYATGTYLAQPGGCGGGEAGNGNSGVATTGVSGQGFGGAVSVQWNAGTLGCGGGGGTGAVGTEPTGGIGTQVNIDGNNYYWGGGGGGGNHNPSGPASGGLGGGGGGSAYYGGSPGGGSAINAGGNAPGPAKAGGAGGQNSGGGAGGGADASPAGASGGSGIVILRMADGDIGTAVGAETPVTNVGGSGETVITWLGTGTYTA